MTLGNVGARSAPVKWLNKGWESIKEVAHDAITHFVAEDSNDGDKDVEAKKPGNGQWGIVAVDVTDHDNVVEARFEVPGLTKEDLSVALEAGRLTVTGEKRKSRNREEGGCYISERAFGRFQRTVPLPTEVDADAAKAQYVDGVLIVSLPKCDTQPNATIKVA